MLLPIYIEKIGVPVFSVHGVRRGVLCQPSLTAVALAASSE
jgi:hypothetical protein